ncbi:hypothetical protein J2S20_002244 [Moryella indoligenes]|uniref:Uncharacterized protein n=1 Tax=Moryella indoligenes TaxID=371674 RepID=A0AAE3VC30_9FIRM|nr:hypothetical protein [Moryella indoligenes]MDQ0153523.1 hypothetical protein [Moryella indoligenes]
MKQSTNYSFNKPEDGVDFIEAQPFSENFEAIDGLIKALSDEKTNSDGGEAAEHIVTFGAASGITSFQSFLDTVKSGGKIGEFFRNFKAGMKYVLDQGKLVNNCVSTSTTLPLAASQGKVLQDQITTLNSKLNVKEISGVVESSSFYVFYTMEELTLGTVKIPRYARGIYIGYETNAAILAVDYSGKLYHAYRSAGVWKSI